MDCFGFADRVRKMLSSGGGARASLNWHSITAEKRRTVRLLIGLLALVAAIFSGLPREHGQLLVTDELLRDGILRAQAGHRPETRVTLVDIDEASIAALGAWPWHRDLIADLAETLLSDYRARGIALDIVFPDLGDPVGDARLASLAEHAPITMAVVLDYEHRPARVNQGRLPRQARPLSAGKRVDALGFVGNHAGFEDAACTGNIGFKPDSDGALRRLPMLSRVSGVDFAHLSFALLTCGGAGAALRIPGTLPMVEGFWRVPILRSPEAYTVIPAAAVLGRTAPAELLERRWVIVGSSALGLGDRVATPLSRNTPGFLVHALAVSALLDASEHVGWRMWPGTGLTLAWAGASLVFLLWAIPRISVWAGAALLLAVALAWMFCVWMATALGGVVPVTPVLAAYLVVFVLAIPYEWWLAQRESRGVLSMFAQYLSPSVVAELMRIGPDKHLQPALKEVTVLIADMEGYTLVTSMLPLAEAVELTQSFLGCLTRPILDQGGTLDKYTGDGVVAFWGAPLPCIDHADRAVASAQGIVQLVDQANRQRIAAGKRPVRVRIGIESGHALVGDLGTEFRSAYTAVGDCINFASKLQETAKNLPVRIVVGPRASSLVKGHALTSLGVVDVLGTGQSLELFTVASAQSDPPPALPSQGG